MDGDARRLINLVTKTAGERPTVTVSVWVLTPILGGRNLVETAGTLGKRFGRQKKIRICSSVHL